MHLWTHVASSPSGRSPTSARSRAPPAPSPSPSPPSPTRSPSSSARSAASCSTRGPGGPRLTRAGEALLAHADVIAERFDLATTQLDEILRDQDARLRIGAVPSALGGLVPAALQRVRARDPTRSRPSWKARPICCRPACARASSTSPSASRTPPEHATTTKASNATNSSANTSSSPSHRDHRLAGNASVRLADLADDDWIAASADGIIVRACRAAGFEPRLVSITRDQFAIRALITRGLAVTLAAELLAEAFEHAALRPIAGPAPERDVYALLPPGGRHPLAEPTLVALTEEARELRAA